MADLTPAAELREAAKLMREQHGPGHVRHAFWFAAADLLESGAERLEGNPFGAKALIWRAHLVAQAYLGTAESEPAATEARA